jgi:hypothetical protein
MKELVKNTADYTITNVTGIGYDVWVGRHEHTLLKQVVGQYKRAVVISAGTEFINGNKFFDNLPEDFFILGHVLDMGDGYYGLHHQCYVIDLDLYAMLGNPEPGQTQLLEQHIQTVPNRSKENIHDDYTPLWISKGSAQKVYKHKFHGWRIISAGLEADYKIYAFDSTLRDGKHFLYCDVDTSDWIYKRYNHCLQNHVYKDSTGSVDFPRPYNCNIDHLIYPAAGTTWLDKLKKHGYDSSTKVTFYDYNQSALDYMQANTRDMGLIFEFALLDAIAEPECIVELVDKNCNPQGVVIHMSNIFSYEGTASLMPLKYRVQQENKLIESVQSKIPMCVLEFDQRAAEGFVPWRAETGLAKDLELTDLSTAVLPPWHTYD